MKLRSNSYEGRYLELTVEEVSFDTTRQTHTLSWVLTSTGGISSRYYVADTTVTIAGVQVYFYDAPYWSENTVFPFPITTGQVSGTLEVSHSEEVQVSLSTRVYVSMTPETWEGTLPLTNLSTDTGTGQAAQIIAAENGTLGTNLGITWIPRSTSHVYTLSYVLRRTADSVTEQSAIHRPSTAAVPYRGIIPLDYALAEDIPNAVTRELEITLTTYATDAFQDADILGRDTATVTVTVPEDDHTRPVITAGSCAPSPDLLAGAFVQSKTGVQATVTAEGKLGATIASTYLRCEGENFDGPSRPLAQWGQVAVQLYAVDSRGFLSQPYPVTLEVIPYLNPKLRPAEGRSRVTAQRCDAEGNPDDKGTYLTIAARRSYSPVAVNGVQQNFCTISYRFRPAQGEWSSWQEILPEAAASDAVITGPLLGSLTQGLSYEVELRALDTLGGESTTTLTLTGDRIYWHRDGQLGSLGFGELVTQADTFLIGRDKTLTILGGLSLSGDAAAALLDLAHPVGSILETVSAESPETTLGGTWVTVSGTEDSIKWRRTG